MVHRAPRALRLVMVASLLVAGCSGVGSPAPSAVGSPDATASIGTAEASRQPLTLAGTPLTRCGLAQGGGTVVAQCGTLRVPEDPTNPDGRQIDLKVAVIPAVSATPEPDPVFILAGGPGGAASRDLAWTAARYHGVHRSRDIVLVDQRGTGASNDLRFDVPPDLGALTPEETERELRSWITAQLAKLDADPRMYTTAPAMDDIDAVRVALGYDQINLMGSSYGATAAQYYIRQHGEHLRSVILDGATLIDVPVFELIAPNSQRALDMLFERCAADASCSRAYPDLRAEFTRVTRTLAAGAVTSDVTSRFTDQPIVVSATSFAGIVHQGLVSSDQSAGLPWLIHAAAQGRWDQVAAAIAATEQPEQGLQVMSGVIRCSEAWAVFDPDAVARLGAGSYLLDVELFLARQQAASCALAPQALVPPNDGARATTSVPVLLLVGDADPQDPPSNIASAATDFPNSLTVVVPGQGHTVAHLGCVPTIVDAFIAAGSVTGLDASCVTSGGADPPSFRLP